MGQLKGYGDQQEITAPEKYLLGILKLEETLIYDIILLLAGVATPRIFFELKLDKRKNLVYNIKGKRGKDSYINNVSFL